MREREREKKMRAMGEREDMGTGYRGQRPLAFGKELQLRAWP